MREGKDYYMTHSAFDYQPGLTVWHSRDLVNWEPISYALKTYLGSVWAPDICKYKDRYYIYFTVASRPRSNYVVWAKSPYGPWSDPINLQVQNIDPCHVVGEDGSRWLFMSGGKRVKLRDDGLSIVPGTEEVVYKGWPIPEDWITEGMALEGPKLRKIGGWMPPTIRSSIRGATTNGGGAKDMALLSIRPTDNGLSYITVMRTDLPIWDVRR